MLLGILALLLSLITLLSVPVDLAFRVRRQTSFRGDLTVRWMFDPETVGPLEQGEAPDLPGGATRRTQLAQGIEWTVVNGRILLERGKHTGDYPGMVARSSGPTQSIAAA